MLPHNTMCGRCDRRRLGLSMLVEPLSEATLGLGHREIVDIERPAGRLCPQTVHQLLRRDDGLAWQRERKVLWTLTEIDGMSSLNYATNFIAGRPADISVGHNGVHHI